MSMILMVLIIPIAVVLISLALQRVLRCPVLVAGVTFSVFLILSYTVLTTAFLINTILYTILSYITAVLYKLICNFFREYENKKNSNLVVEKNINHEINKDNSTYFDDYNYNNVYQETTNNYNTAFNDNNKLSSGYNDNFAGCYRRRR